MSSDRIPPRPTSSGTVQRAAPFVVLAAAVVASILVLRTWFDARGGSQAVGRAATCYYDGAPHNDCPTPRTGARTDTAWLYAAAIDTLYVRAEGTVGPATLIALDTRLAVPAATAMAGDSLARALVTAAPALTRGVADSLAGWLRAAATAGALPLPLWTVGAKQRPFDAAAAARAIAGQATKREDALPPRGLLALSRPAFDASGQWALVYAERTVLPERNTDPATSERRYVLCTRLPDGRWRAVRVLDA